MSDLVGTPEDRFSRVTAHFIDRKFRQFETVKHSRQSFISKIENSDNLKQFNIQDRAFEELLQCLIFINVQVTTNIFVDRL